MLTHIVRMNKMSYLNIQNRSQCSFGCALEVHSVLAGTQKILRIFATSFFLLLLRPPNVVLVLKYGESNAMESALNTCQMPQTAC